MEETFKCILHVQNNSNDIHQFSYHFFWILCKIVRLLSYQTIDSHPQWTAYNLINKWMCTYWKKMFFLVSYKVYSNYSSVITKEKLHQNVHKFNNSDWPKNNFLKTFKISTNLIVSKQKGWAFIVVKITSIFVLCILGCYYM